jgi:hypothetical protein
MRSPFIELRHAESVGTIMSWQPIHKQRLAGRARPNLGDYEQACASFSWNAVRDELNVPIAGGGFNIAGAIDRHAAGPLRDHLAIRWLGESGATRDFSYRELQLQTNRFANVLRTLGINKGDRVFAYAGRILDLYVAALGALKNMSVFCARRLYRRRLPFPRHQVRIDDDLQKKDAVHAGFAIALRQGGLIAPAIHDVHLKTLDELMAAIHDLVPRARSGRLRSSELTDATVTVTNLGDLGVKSLFGVIYPPQVALVGFGKIADRPWAEADKVSIRPILTATLSADHRATDGMRGAQFLERLNEHLQTPEQL